MRYWLLLALLVVAVMALGSGFDLLYRLAFLVAVILAIAPVWAWYRLRGVTVEVQREVSQTQVGNSFLQRVTVSHHGRSPRPRVEFREPSDLPGHEASAILNLPEDGSRSWQVTTLCRRRGRFTLGPAVIAGSDPFGLFRFQRKVTGAFSLLVYPRMVDLPRFVLPSTALPEHGHRQRRGQQASTSAVTVREYAAGDSFQRIHWPSTARLRKLMVKEFELETSSDVWLVLDLDRNAHRGQDEDGTEEYAVTVAASLARQLLQAEYSVGLLLGGKSVHRLPGGRGSHQLRRVLEVLAEAHAKDEAPLAEGLAKHGHQLNHRSTVIVITPSADRDWPVAVGQLTNRGMRAVAVLVDASSFAETRSPATPAEVLAARGVPVYLVRRGDNLAAALARPSDQGSGRRREPVTA